MHRRTCNAMRMMAQTPCGSPRAVLKLSGLFCAICAGLWAQTPAHSQPGLDKILERLDNLEKQNQQLLEEIRSLRQELDESRTSAEPEKSEPSLEDRVAVEEQRTAEQAQTKVEASHKFPIQLNGMLLFNAFANSRYAASDSPANYGFLTGPNRSGATVRQTLLGLDFQGPALPGNGRVNGSLLMDFWAGPPDPGDNWLRIRRADVSFDWAQRSFSVRQDKPIISPYQPDSLAEVGVPPLSTAGNLWLWLPQARYEERVRLGASSGITGQVAVIQTEEHYSGSYGPYARSLETARPALEGRLAFWHKFDDNRRFEIAPGFHVSTTHVAGNSIASRIASLDWAIVPSPYLKLTGTAYTGQDVSVLGALGDGFTVGEYGGIKAVKSSGGWAQFSFPITQRLTFNVFSGLQDNRGTYLIPSTVVRNLEYAANVMYRVGPNVILSAEALQLRSRLVSGDNESHNHYDLAIGYLF